MKSLWRIPDFLDLELFFIQDKQLEEEQGIAALRDRDRTLYLDSIGGEDGSTDPDREWLIHRWLQERRSSENQDQGGQALLPGRMWYELYGLFWAICSFLAFAVGAGLCYSYLSYSGEQAVNVSLFFLVFVGFQFALLLVIPLAWLLRKIRGQDLRSSLLLSLVNTGLNRILFKVRKSGFDTMSGTRKSQFAASLAAVRTRGKGYGTLFFWPLFLLFQLFGIALNFGTLAALFIKVASSDLAFGWQSTIQLSSDFVAKCVQWIALPWSWFLGASSFPDYSQIEGSRMVLKDGFYHLASADLVSWWPFLCLSICVYCLLSRILLFVFGSLARKRALARVSFSRVEHNQLVHRLLTPRLNTQIKTVSVAVKPVEDTEIQPHKTKVETVVARKQETTEAIEQAAVNGTLLALVPDELFDDCSPAELGKYCEDRFGYSITDIVRIDEEYTDAGNIYQKLRQANASICSPVLILQEAWQPPIQEMLRFLKDLRENCEEETHIIVALVGKPTAETIFTPVSENDLFIWKQKITMLVDPALQLTALVDAR